MTIYSLPFQSEMHKRFLQAVKTRWYFSRNEMSKRYTQWAKNEDKFAAYLPTKEADSLKKSSRDQGTPQYTTIDIPYSYAQLLSAHTYWTSVFMSRSPIMQFMGRHGETQQSCEALEAVMDYQVNVGGMMVPLYIWLMDAGKYGFGVVGTYWCEETANITELVEQAPTFLGLPVPGAKPKKVRQTKRVRGYNGNRLYNVRPYDFFPDPRVPMSRFQQGEFCSRYTEVGYNYLAKMGELGKYQNLEEVKKTKPSKWMRDRGSPRVAMPNTEGGGNTPESGGAQTDDINKLDYVELLEMFIELIPADWGLGSSKSPEKWVFTVANDAVIIGCEPLGLMHDQFPFSLLEYEIEGYGMTKRSMMEMIEPLNDVMTWLFNTHFYNVRKVLNDQFVIDPSKIIMKDALDPEPGRMIRLRPSAYGSNPKDAIYQLQTVDVTQNHIRDAQFVSEMIQRMTGVNDNIMGMLQGSGRKTATEVRSSSTFGINRLKTNSEYFSAMGWGPLAQQLVSNTQQKYDLEQKFKIAGSLMTRANRFIDVNPDSILGFYDFVPVDGTLPVDKFALANLWKELMAQMAQFPSLMMEYDLGAVFGYVAQLGGAKNLDQFKLNVVPDEVLLAQMQQGNMIKLGAKGGGLPGTTRSLIESGGGGRDTPGPPQLPGMGPTE